MVESAVDRPHAHFATARRRLVDDSKPLDDDQPLRRRRVNDDAEPSA